MTGSSTDDIEARRRRDLAEFLKARRAAMKPGDYGMPKSGRRRTPGLRREEVAQISGIGLTWYTWLEQGRDIQVSAGLLQRLTRVLRLSPHDAAYLFSLAGQPATSLSQEAPAAIAGLQTVLDGYIRGPAVAVDGTGTTLACNLIGDFVYHFSGYEGPWGDNIFWRLFMDPYRRALYRDWPDFARYSVGLMRGLYASRKADSAYCEMIEDLRGRSAEFSEMWSQSAPQGVSSIAPSQVQLQVPELGPLNFLSVRLAVPTSDAMVLFASPVDEATTAAMLRLSPAP